MLLMQTTATLATRAASIALALHQTSVFRAQQAHPNSQMVLAPLRARLDTGRIPPTRNRSVSFARLVATHVPDLEQRALSAKTGLISRMVVATPPVQQEIVVSASLNLAGSLSRMFVVLSFFFTILWFHPTRVQG